MSLSTSSNRINYTADGILVAFSFPYLVYDASHIAVYLNGALQSSGYVVSDIGDPAGSLVTFDIPPTTGTLINILRSVPNTQQVTLAVAGAFPAKTIEKALDLDVMGLQQFSERLDRAITVPVDEASIASLPTAADRANKYFGFDSSGAPIAITANNASGTSVTATGSLTARLLADRAAEYVNVRDFGALGNDAADDTTAIQAAFDFAVGLRVGTILFPRGIYRHTALTLAPASGQIHINLLGLGGAGGNGIRLKYTGVDGTALTIKNNTRFSVENLAMENAGTGAPTGLFVTSLAFGSSTGPAHFQNVRISGFNKNYVVGQSTGESASEFTYNSFEVTDGVSHGIELNGSNSLNHQFYGLNMSGNATGLEAVDPDCIFIHGGSASNNTVQDFAFRQAGAFFIKGYRSEGANRFVTVGPDSPAGAAAVTAFTMTGCRITQTLAADNRAVRLNKSGLYTISNNSIEDGHVYINTGNTVYAALTLTHNVLVSSTDLEIGNTPGTSQYIKVKRFGNNTAAVGAGSYWPVSQISGELNEYAEGTWTPSVGGSATYTSRSGSYTKVGRLVTVHCNMTINAIGTGSTSDISGLPFTVNAPSGVGAVAFYNLAASSVAVSASGTNGSTIVSLQSIAAAGTSMSTRAILGNGTQVVFTLTYETAS